MRFELQCKFADPMVFPVQLQRERILESRQTTNLRNHKNKMKELVITKLTTLVAAMLMAHCVQPQTGADAPKDIVAVAAESGSFNTLVAAVKAAGLVETLQGDGPFTVFAPTDEAFAKLASCLQL